MLLRCTLLYRSRHRYCRRSRRSHGLRHRPEARHHCYHFRRHRYLPPRHLRQYDRCQRKSLRRLRRRQRHRIQLGQRVPRPGTPMGDCCHLRDPVQRNQHQRHLQVPSQGTRSLSAALPYLLTYRNRDPHYPQNRCEGRARWRLRRKSGFLPGVLLSVGVLHYYQRPVLTRSY